MKEYTSTQVAAFAGEELATFRASQIVRGRRVYLISVGDMRKLRAVCASALNQARDRVDGFDPRDGGKVGRQIIPRSKRWVRPKKTGKRSSSAFYPGARPPRNSP